MADTNYYYDFNFPMPIVKLIMSLLNQKKETPTQQADSSTREWFSQTRTSRDTTTEVVTTAFQLPLSVSEVTLEILRMPCSVEVWYQDRSNNWRPVLDTRRNPISTVVSRSDANVKSWYKFNTRCYPIVAKQVQFRMTRTPDPELFGVPYPVGLRNCLIRRNVYDRSQGGGFEDQVDVMGNVVSRYVKDWDSIKAIDDNYTTFWKSEPQPDPAAVVSLFLDVRSLTGAPQVIDKVYLDPIYSGQHLNLYYSSDDTVGTRVLSPITIPASKQLDVDWRVNSGLEDIATGDNDSYYRWPMKVGPQNSQDAWIGVEWRPSFASAGTNLAQNPILFSVNDPTLSAANGSPYQPSVYYDPASKKFFLEFFNGTSVRTYSSLEIVADWAARDEIRIIAGWTYATKKVYIKVVNQLGTVLTDWEQDAEDLPTEVSFSGTAKIANMRGIITNLIIKLDTVTSAMTSFLANPTYYCDPDPVIRDESGRVPSTTLDNAIYSAPFYSREHGSGGAHESHFEDKEWTPVWRDYTASKGFLILPQPISMKYLKLEFTNLTEEAYPIYESGIETRYKVFPVSVTQQSSMGPKLYTGEGGFLGMGTFISVNGVRSVNWFNPASVMQATGAVIGPQTPPVIINTGIPYVTSTLPNQGAELVESSRRIEAASSYVYARDTLQPYVLATDQYTTTIKAEGLQAIQPYVDVPWEDIEAANPGAVTKVRSTGTVAIRGTDWWIYPGQQLKIPASVMTKITDTETVTERKLTLETRNRFNTVSVHRYTYKTLRRDSAMAYFAGVREVQPYTSSYINEEDRPSFDFPIYDPLQWSFGPSIVRATAPTDAANATDGQENPIGPIGIGLATAGTAFKALRTQSEFSKLTLDYRDSGLLRSNSLWATATVTGEGSDQLSANIDVSPSEIPAGTWSDVTSTWLDDDTKWGSPYGVVSANINNERQYKGNRVLSFSRDADASGTAEAGINLNQHVNFVPQGLVRMGMVFFKPYASTNTVRLRLARASDNTVIHTETITPKIGRWVDHTTQFVEIPPTLERGTFDEDYLTSWTPDGSALWTQDDTVGRTGTGSAKIVTDGTGATLTTEKMRVYLGNDITGTAWVKWSGLTSQGTGRLFDVKAIYYAANGDVAEIHDLDGGVVSSGASTDSNGWVPIGGTINIPESTVATDVAFQITVSDAVGADTTVWFDDAIADVPGAVTQTYNLSLTVVGGSRDTLYVSDLYCQIAPIRYFVQLGGEGSTLHEVTDLRHTKNKTIVTASPPVNEIGLYTTILSPKGWAFGCKATPLYLR